MQIIHIANGDYNRYEELLLKRDALEKAAEQFLMAYTREFGDSVTEIFQCKIECIRLKKMISYCIVQKNKGLTIDAGKISDIVTEEMTHYYKQLEYMIADCEASRKAKIISEAQVKEIKRIYREIAKLLHPDMSPLAQENPQLAELFQRVIIAYKCNDLKELEELQVLINGVLDSLGVKEFNMVIPDIEEKMTQLDREINNIITTEPYIYGELLADEKLVAKKHEELKEELLQYISYQNELNNQLNILLGN